MAVVVSPPWIADLHNKALSMAKELGYAVEPLTDRELSRFALSYERQFILVQREREIIEMYRRHMAEALLGAIVAKRQMSAEIEGEQPSSTMIGGPIDIRAGFLGVGDDWEDAPAFTTGSPQNWIHSGTALLGGTAGNPVRIGGNAVHVIFGIASFHPSPKIESVQFTIDGKSKPVLVTGWPLKKSNLAVKEFDNCYVLKKATTLLVKVFISEAFGSSAVDYPKLIGVSFIREDALRLHDVATLPGTTYDVIYAT
jgi:hypothetical protein